MMPMNLPSKATPLTFLSTETVGHISRASKLFNY